MFHWEKDRDEDDQVDAWCFPERKTDEDAQVDVWCFPERKTEMRMLRWMCGVSLKERQRWGWSGGCVVFHWQKDSLGVEAIGDVMRRGRPRCHGHMEWKDDTIMCKVGGGGECACRQAKGHLGERVCWKLSRDVYDQWWINHGTDGAHARGSPPPSTNISLRQHVLYEMVQFVAFPVGIDRTTPSNKATLLCREGVSSAI